MFQVGPSFLNGWQKNWKESSVLQRTEHSSRMFSGCQYGNHFTWCQRLERYQCNDEYYSQECCGTCAQYAATSKCYMSLPDLHARLGMNDSMQITPWRHRKSVLFLFQLQRQLLQRQVSSWMLTSHWRTNRMIGRVRSCCWAFLRLRSSPGKLQESKPKERFSLFAIFIQCRCFPI